MDVNSFIERLKSDFSINSDLRDVKFRDVNIEPYSLVEKDKFGEKKCLLYSTTISMYNTTYFLKILSFKYSSHSEVLKLEIHMIDEVLSREIASCRNFLQRRRNLSLTFEVLLKCSKLIESRRLIANVVLKRQSGVSLVWDETGLKIICSNTCSNVLYFDACWSFLWDWVDCQIRDYYEFYCNESEAKCAAKLKAHLNFLDDPSLSFQMKMQFWRALMREIRIFQQENYSLVVEIDDSDDDSGIDFRTESNKYKEVLIID